MKPLAVAYKIQRLNAEGGERRVTATKATSHLPSGAVREAKIPMTKEPETFTAIVPQGKVSPKRCATTPDSQNLPMPPKALPKPTQK